VLSRDPGKLGEVCDAFFNQLMTSDTYEQVIESAVALSFIKDPVAVPYLERMLNTDKMVEPIAIQGLARINDRGAVDVLINALKLQKPEITASAQYALSQIEVETKDPSVKQQIRRALKKNN
jgi:HEAT repeat protein